MAIVVFILIFQNSRYPAFCAVVLITAFGNENVICFIHSVYAWTLIARVTQGILPTVHCALPDQHNAATMILVSISPFSGSCTKRFTKIGHG
ncbi:hypothetical protein ALP31_200078 [Pseudomonas amygdali pv. morsprunorum]|nr:hypothetical protein ALP31_200078 [Pseudomonas amygdali pv. morsprunorum]